MPEDKKTDQKSDTIEAEKIEPGQSESEKIKPDQAEPAPERSASKGVAGKLFPVIGLGASAGGLEALKTFFAEVSKQSGMAYIVVVHMTAKQPSLMAELVQNVACIPVTAAKDGEPILPDHVYICPPGKEISLYNGLIQLLDLVEKPVPLPIDFFLNALAQERGHLSAAVILSGTGTDGSRGIKEIKACDGLVLAQSEDSARYDGMPRSALGTGLVDMVLPPEQMPLKIMQYFKQDNPANWNAGPEQQQQQEGDAQQETDWLHKVYALLRARTGHDFSAYKKNTLLRRIGRRMSLNQADDYNQYVKMLRENPDEIESLFRELLIGVTNFFRDPDSFKVLSDTVLPDLFARMKDDDTFRAWVPGCSTGEEVYSLVMVFKECLDKISRRINLQVFATDINKYAIERAREGVFPSSIRADVSPERLKRFFTEEGDYFRIRKEIRESMIFSVQDVLKDPPFSRLNLLCCRNLLIYLDAAAQKKLLPLFHYTLAPQGVLILGSSETIGGFTTLFEIVDNKWKIFKRREVPPGLIRQVVFPSGLPEGIKTNGDSRLLSSDPKADIGVMIRKMILDRFTPTAVLVEPKGEILHVQGRTGKYLENITGPPTRNILDMAREGLRIELYSAMRAAVAEKNEVICRNVHVRTNGAVQIVDLHVVPLEAPLDLAGRLLILFEDIDAPPEKSVEDTSEKDLSPSSHDARIIGLEKELQNTRESHQITIEELESSNEELKSTNEELQSSNEELQSTNEELESSKEELQSLNEELQTVNSELQGKVDELSTAHDDMRNLLNSTNIATIFVDNMMRIKRFTREAVTIINLIQSDIGRPLNHVVSNLDYNDMIEDLTEVLEKLTPREKEVQTKNGKWFNMRIMPYRTTDNRIDGAVLTFVDIDNQKKVQQALKLANSENIELEQSRLLIFNVLDMNPKPLVVLDQHMTMVISNTTFNELMNIVLEQTGKRNIFDIGNKVLAETDLKTCLESALAKGDDFKTSAFTLHRPKGKKAYQIRGRIIRQQEGLPYRILLNFETVEEG